MSKRYLDSIYIFLTGDSQRALMINGNWGSGKTYFVKNKLIPFLKEKEIPSIYVSLYGHNSLESITSSIYNNMLMDKSGLMYQIIPYAEKTITLLGNLNKGFKALTDVFPIDRKSLKTVLSDASKYLLIFDDLERSSIDYEDVLGYINNISEHSGNNVIIVANESEISRVTHSIDLPLKYQTALLATNYIYEKTKPLFKISTQKNKDRLSVENLEDLKKKTSSIFDSDSRYDIIKEKIIEKTITFKPNITEVFDNILSDSDFEENYILESKKTEIIALFDNREHSNIRSIQTFLSTFKKFANLISSHQASDADAYSEFIDIIITCIASSTIRYKSGYEKSTWVNGSEFGMVDFGKDIFTSRFYSFKFVEDYIWDSIFDESKVIETINSFLSKQTLSKDDAIHKLPYYWQMEDEDIEIAITDIKNGLVKSKYSRSSFELIITIFLKLNELGFEIDMKSIVMLMEKSKNYNQNSLENFMNYEINLSEASKNEFSSLISRVNIKQAMNIQKNYGDRISDILDTHDWQNKLYNFYFEERSYFYDSKGFLYFVDIDKLMNNLNCATNFDFANFRRTLVSIYDRSTLNVSFSLDYNNFIKLNEYLSSAKYSIKTKEMNRKLLQEFIENTIPKLREPLKDTPI